MDIEALVGRITTLEAVVGRLVSTEVDSRKRHRPGAWDFTSMRDAVDPSDNLQGQLRATMKAVFGDVVTEITDVGGTPKNAHYDTPKYGLISDAEHAWYKIDAIDTAFKKIHSLEKQFNYWTPFLEGLYVSLGDNAYDLHKKGEQLCEERAALRNAAGRAVEQQEAADIQMQTTHEQTNIRGEQRDGSPQHIAAASTCSEVSTQHRHVVR